MARDPVDGLRLSSQSNGDATGELRKLKRADDKTRPLEKSG